MDYKPEIIVRNENLPSTFEDVSSFVIVAREKLKSIRAEMSAIKRLGLANEVYEQKKREAQELSELSIRAELKLGEIIASIPTAQGIRKDVTSSSQAEEVTKEQSLNKIGMKRNRAYELEKISRNPEIVEKSIEEARENDDIVSRSSVLKKIQKQKSIEKREETQDPAGLPDGKFQIIYCDPPWQYDNTGFDSSAEKHYPTMSTDDLKEIDVKSLYDDNAVMFMWATNPLLKDALSLMESWGFEYKTNIAWVKDRQIHLGFYVYGKHELLLIGTKGSMVPLGEKSSSVITGSNSIHSKKPESVYETIEKMYPKMKYVELFARNTPRPGWEKWGNQVGKYD